jgi:peptidoglycan/LPS O-acetylase OafA/YrhL
MEIQQKLRCALESKVIAGLDVARTAAISLVLLFHWGARFPGPMGVMIFFVLSGFLITSMLLKEYEKSGTISLRMFYKRRAFRIFPTFYVCWVISTILLWTTAAGRKAPAWQLAASFFYLEDYARALQPTLQTDLHMWISWSLAIEEQFYLLWPVLLLILAARRGRMTGVVSAIIIAVCIHRTILMLGFGFTWIYLYNAFDTRADALMVGSLLAILVRKQDTTRILMPVLRWQWLALGPPLMLAVLTYHGFWPRSTILGLLRFSLQPLVIAIMLLQFIYWGWRDWPVFHNGIIRFIARISYALYLYHIPAMEIAGRLHEGKSFSIPITFAMATASYFLIEKPFMRMQDKKKTPIAPGAYTLENG